jgi:acetyl esterase
VAELHPQVRALLASQTGEEEPAELEAQRAAYLQTSLELGGPLTPVERTEDIVISAGDRRLAARAYWPKVPASPTGMLVFFHGGGWVLGGLDSHDGVARALAATSGHVVVHVDYRLAPEHPFPAPRDDAIAAVRWARTAAAAQQLGTEPGVVAVAGDSAGGNLAALAALAARDDGLPPLRLQLLIYPALDAAMTSDSYTMFADGPMLTRGEMAECWSVYLAGAGGAQASPLAMEDVAGVAPAAIAVAGHDVLRDDGLRYASALHRAGVPAAVENFEDMVHAFIRFAGVVDRAGELQRWAGERVREALG